MEALNINLLLSENDLDKILSCREFLFKPSRPVETYCRIGLEILNLHNDAIRELKDKKCIPNGLGYKHFSSQSSHYINNINEFAIQSKEWSNKIDHENKVFKTDSKSKHYPSIFSNQWWSVSPGNLFDLLFQ